MKREALEELLELDEIVRYRSRRHWVAYVVAWLWLLGLLMPSSLFKQMRAKIWITDRHVLGQYGTYWRHELVLSFSQLHSVNVKMGALGRVFDYGRVILRTKNGRKIEFIGLEYPFEIQQILEEAMIEALTKIEGGEKDFAT